ncbi:MAG: tRNA (N6-isopentenyl adenosine(37)-C2)-methylthiotransferase MiaB [Candidatus Omnitrophica bacterium]|nr:tRNA (N6-isopentenyl adenosine(37)-C2)-methylthiotransferase MiaB [Candidatus Omnitrophota bacterium]
MVENAGNGAKNGDSGGKSPKKLRVLLRTFGCQMNVRDSEIVLGILKQAGYVPVDTVEEADVVLFNTCSVRRHAEQRAISNMGILLKRRQAKTKIYGMIGCTAQALKGDLFQHLPGLSLVCGTGEIHRLPELIEQARQAPVLACGHLNGDIPEISCDYRQNKASASVLIMRGCNNFCSYCIVPFVRGKERSRQAGDIVQEIEALAREGIKEVMLLGQNVNSYRDKDVDFVDLLQQVNAIDGIEKIRFMTSHPKDASLKLFEAIRDLGKVDKHLHLPLQSGSDRILKLMNRGYTAKKYLGLIKQLRKLLPGCRISTDIIVGFPGEKEADFQKTLRLMKKIRCAAAYIFKYSPRPPAQSADLIDDVPKEVKEKRHRIILNLQRSISKMAKTVKVVILILAFSFLGVGQLFAASDSLKRAETLLLKEAYPEAAKECQRVLSGGERRRIKSKAQYLLGLSLLKQGKFEPARENFRQILRQGRSSEFSDDAALGIADSYFLAGEASRAQVEYEQFLKDFKHSELIPLAREHLNQCTQGTAYNNSYFSVQLGCFSNKGNAENLRDELIHRGYQAYIVDSSGAGLFRVLVGKFNNRLQAELLEQKLKKQGYATKVCP